MSRTVGHEPWLAVFRDEIIEIIAEGLTRTDAVLNAYVIMSNHFHLVVKQGVEPLSALMQPICRRVALRTHRIHSREGHIVERRFRSKTCLTPAHLRRAITYAHRNPVKAQMCAQPGAYPWSSHWAYVGQPAPSNVTCCSLPIVPELSIYASEQNRTQVELHADYERYADYCEADALRSEDQPPPEEPPVLAGDQYWVRYYGALAAPIVRPNRTGIIEIANSVLAALAPEVTLQELRLRRGGKLLSLVRRTSIERAILTGHRFVEIARALNTSETTVSKIARSLFSGGA